MQIGVESGRAVENKRIFVIDDDEVSGIALQFMLADENETHVFGELDAALDKASAWPPQLILLGHGLCRGGEAALIARIRAHLAGVKIVLVCDAGSAPELATLRGFGADGLLTRPLELATVRRKVDAQLGRRTPLGIPLVVR
ncbi:response regulator [Aromatoleum toluvorans]|uniref:Response regulator n=1 Tax=Aromatoleum toluvorans TaxID=92002 RepID=A0ABX1PXD7_9RHOO|nr:response regulator [Aromatoleum toluvorans]NMG43855.1 response regulator [Aromatoleum toluvorans]